ncbi:hypothetical protein D9M71_771170 [compost metagenome]
MDVRLRWFVSFDTYVQIVIELLCTQLYGPDFLLLPDGLCCNILKINLNAFGFLFEGTHVLRDLIGKFPYSIPVRLQSMFWSDHVWTDVREEIIGVFVCLNEMRCVPV